MVQMITRQKSSTKEQMENTDGVKSFILLPKKQWYKNYKSSSKQELISSKVFLKNFLKSGIIPDHLEYIILEIQIKRTKGMVYMKNLVNHIIKNGGATYNLMGGQFITSGYMCAKAENEMIISEELTCNHILGYMARYAADLQKDNANLGAWYNSEDGKTYLDTSYRFETLEEAIAFGKANNQLAIFDLNTFTEIRL